MRTTCHIVGLEDYNALYDHQRIYKLAVQIKNVLEIQLVITLNSKMIKCWKDLHEQSSTVSEYGKIKVDYSRKTKDTKFPHTSSHWQILLIILGDFFVFFSEQLDYIQLYFCSFYNSKATLLDLDN